MSNELAVKLRQVSGAVRKVMAQHEVLLQLLQGHRSLTEEIDSIEGRRIFYTYTDTLDFTIAQLGQRAEPLNFQISQDGPFVMTHYPIFAWQPSAPATATNLGQWSPCASWPLPAQESADPDRIDLSYEFIDGGNSRNFQNAAVGPMISRPDYLIPLPVPTLFSPNSVIAVFPTFEDIFFNGNAATPATGGTLWCGLPGYRIVNM